MNAQIEKRFEKIAEDTISQAERVQCSMDEFKEGLKMIADAVLERLSLEA